MQRQSRPRELADSVFYLVSDRPTYVIGATPHVSGALYSSDSTQGSRVVGVFFLGLESCDR